MEYSKEVEVGRLCLVLQAPYDATDGHDDNSYALSVCSGELCRITLAPVQGTDGNTYLKAKSADALEAATTATRRVDGCLLINGSREVLNACDYLRSADVRAHALFKLQPSNANGLSQSPATLLCHASETNFRSPYLLRDGAWDETAIASGLIRNHHVAGWRVIHRRIVNQPGGVATRLVAIDAQLGDLYSAFGTPTEESRAFFHAVNRWAAAKSALLPPVRAGQLLRKLEYKPPTPPAAATADPAAAAAAAAAAQPAPPAAAVQSGTGFGAMRRDAANAPLVLYDLPHSGPGIPAGPLAAELAAAQRRYGVDYQAEMLGGKVYGVRRGAPFDDAVAAIQRHQQQQQPQLNERQQQQLRQGEQRLQDLMQMYGLDEDADADADDNLEPREKPLTPPQAAAAAAAAAADRKAGAAPRRKQQPWRDRKKTKLAAGAEVKQERDASPEPAAPAVAAGSGRGVKRGSGSPAAAAVAAGKRKRHAAAAAADAGEQQPGEARDQLNGDPAAAAALAADADVMDLTGDDEDAADLAAAARAAAAAGVPEYAGPAVDCPICFDSTEGQAALQLGCDHVIHTGCLAQYLQTEEALHKDTNQYVCPMCKATAAVPADADGQQPPAGWEISSNHIAKLTMLGALTAEQEERINRQQIRRAVGAEHSCIQCNMLLDLDPGPANAPSAYAVKCGACNTQQCVACGKIWSKMHAKLTCAQMRAFDNNIDPSTRLLLANTVVCGGGCGHGITKDGRRGDSCNVMKCQRCRVYTCFLCGGKLDSSKFDVMDRHHREASQHYARKGHPCYNAMWMKKDVWLRKQGRDQEAAVAAGPPGQAAEAAMARGHEIQQIQLRLNAGVPPQELRAVLQRQQQQWQQQQWQQQQWQQQRQQLQLQQRQQRDVPAAWQEVFDQVQASVQRQQQNAQESKDRAAAAAAEQDGSALGRLLKAELAPWAYGELINVTDAAAAQQRLQLVRGVDGAVAAAEGLVYVDKAMRMLGNNLSAEAWKKLHELAGVEPGEQPQPQQQQQQQQQGQGGGYAAPAPQRMAVGRPPALLYGGILGPPLGLGPGLPPGHPGFHPPPFYMGMGPEPPVPPPPAAAAAAAAAIQDAQQGQQNEDADRARANQRMHQHLQGMAGAEQPAAQQQQEQKQRGSEGADARRLQEEEDRLQQNWTWAMQQQPLMEAEAQRRVREQQQQQVAAAAAEGGEEEDQDEAPRWQRQPQVAATREKRQQQQQHQKQRQQPIQAAYNEAVMGALQAAEQGEQDELRRRQRWQQVVVEHRRQQQQQQQQKEQQEHLPLKVADQKAAEEGDDGDVRWQRRQQQQQQDAAGDVAAAGQRHAGSDDESRLGQAQGRLANRAKGACRRPRWQPRQQ